MSGFDPRRFSPSHADFGKPIEEPTPSVQHEQAPSTSPDQANPWSGYQPAFSIDDPTDAPRRILISFCGPGGHLDANGEALPDHLLIRRARIKTHPDHRGGDQTAWDRVEEAANMLLRLQAAAAVSSV